mmetsp:Transcript_10909/g.20504  ORF Transcript_10909/g.20504 Transcript_10909/m.20504 type:complete len:810 (-) Transcript_10909:254-2683(-)
MSRADPHFQDPAMMPYDPHQPAGHYDDHQQFASAAEMHSQMGPMGTMGSKAMMSQRIDEETGRAPARCTDMACCTMFFIFLIIMITVRASVGGRGNPARLSHGTDYFGRICGVDNGVENMPFLFWCRKDAPPAEGQWPETPAAIDLQYPSCVVSCPTSAQSLDIACLLPSLPSDPQKLGGGQFGNVETLQVTLSESIVLTAPYATEARGGRFCVPKDQALKDTVMNDNTLGLGPESRYRLNVTIGTLHHLYFWLFISMLTSSVLSMFYYYSMKHCPKAVATVFLVPMIVLFAFTCVFSFLSIGILVDKSSEYAVWYKGINPVYRTLNWMWGSILNVFIGIYAGLMTAGFVMMYKKFVSAQNTLADLLNAARDCILHVPCMFVQPWIEAFIKYFVFWWGLEGLRFICSVGWLDMNRIHINGVRFAGLSRTFHYWDSSGLWTTWMWFYVTLAFWIFGIMWILEICTATGQFLVSYSVAAWYYSPKHNHVKDKIPLQLGKALYDCLVYHFGSICKGAANVPPTRFYRLPFWIISMIFPKNTCCQCCENLLESALCCGMTRSSLQTQVFADQPDKAIPSKDAYHDIVLRSNDFDPANAKACQLLQHSHKVVQMLYRDLYSTTASIMGVVSISSACGFMVFMFVSELDRYKEEGSVYYVPDPIFVAILAWILAAYVSFGFMTVWEHAADGLLFCYCWNRIHNRKSVDKYIPETLRQIVGWDDTENDRYPYYGKAQNNMYLRYWLPVAKPKAPKKEKKLATDAPMPVGPTPQQSMMSGRPPMQGDPSYYSQNPPPSAPMDYHQPETAPLIDPHHH